MRATPVPASPISTPSLSNKSTVKKRPLKPTTNRVKIYHDTSLNDLHKDHQVNRAISTINQIVKLIFKNTKETTAVTFGSGGKVDVPKQKVPGEDKRFQELSKLVKQLGITIPKKFDSKLALREFFY